MKKYANTMNYGDKLYFPKVEEIETVEITKIIKTSEGIEFQWYYQNKSEITPAISTTVKIKDWNKIYYCRLEDAEKEQYKLRVAELSKLQTAANSAIGSLHRFTNKYFVATEEIQKS